MRVIFFGSSHYVLPVIEKLNDNFELALVLTTEKHPIDPIPAYCLAHGINYRSISGFGENLKSLIFNLKSPVGVVADFGLIIPTEILDLFPKGILNIHPSLLPKYRGPTPVQTAILNGDRETGVTIIKLDNAVDHGPILSQVKAGIKPTDTSESLYARLFAKGAALITSIIRIIEAGKTIEERKQNENQATFTKRLTRDDGYIDLKLFEISPPDGGLKFEIDRMIRAYYPWPGVWTEVKLKTQNSKLKIIKFLPEQKIQVEGRKPMSYKDFINGYPEQKS